MRSLIGSWKDCDGGRRALAVFQVFCVLINLAVGFMSLNWWSVLNFAVAGAMAWAAYHSLRGGARHHLVMDGLSGRHKNIMKSLGVHTRSSPKNQP